MKVPELDERYREARRQAYGQCIARLQHGSRAAASTLLKIMVFINARASCRLRAADSVLNHTAKAIEIQRCPLDNRSCREQSLMRERPCGTECQKCD